MKWTYLYRIECENNFPYYQRHNCPEGAIECLTNRKEFNSIILSATKVENTRQKSSHYEID